MSSAGEPRTVWSVAEAKARFSEVLERARSNGPQTITRNGRDAAVVISAEDWRRRAARPDRLGDFLATSPLLGSGLALDRSAEEPRELDL